MTDEELLRATKIEAALLQFVAVYETAVPIHFVKDIAKAYLVAKDALEHIRSEEPAL